MKWIPTPLIKESERPAIPIVDKAPVLKFRSLLIGFNLARLGLKCLFLKITGRLDPKIIGQLLSDFFQKLGVLWIKVGQLFSMRSDILPKALCDQLAKLQDRVEGFPPSLAEEMLRKELDVPIEDIFSEFDSVPFAAASIAQVHRAKLKKENIWVAIKIRRPEIDQVFRKDMKFMGFFIRIIIMSSFFRHIRWDDLLWELNQVLTEELDYFYEASNQERLRQTLSAHDVYVPKVFRAYCTQRILVMEFITAVSMTDYLYILRSEPDRIKKWLRDNGIDETKVARRLMHSFLRQILEDNLFHADLHPGNIFLLRDNRIALLDFGSIGSIEKDMLRKYDAFLMALSQGLYAKAVDNFLMIPPELPSGNITQVQKNLEWGLHSWGTRCQIKELPYKEKSPTFVFDFMTRVMTKNGIAINWSLFKLLRGWGTMDTSLRELNPAADTLYLTRLYSRERKKREFMEVLTELPRSFIELQNLLDYPVEASERALYKGAAVRRMAQVFEGASTRVSKLLATGFGLISKIWVLLSVLIVILGIFQHTSFFSFTSEKAVGAFLNQFPALDIQIWGIFLLFSLRSWLSSSHLYRRLQEND